MRDKLAITKVRHLAKSAPPLPSITSNKGSHPAKSATLLLLNYKQQRKPPGKKPPLHCYKLQVIITNHKDTEIFLTPHNFPNIFPPPSKNSSIPTTPVNLYTILYHSVEKMWFCLDYSVEKM